ncbi:hypothetical protein FIU92_17695 (plasmid) [Ruegeria sp. THAF33]|nr:hypothetical protein FIU92_17695 [Ruegeria sp. THAF33]
MSKETLQQRRKEADELLKKGGLSAKIARAFLKTQATA